MEILDFTELVVPLLLQEVSLLTSCVWNTGARYPQEHTGWMSRKSAALPGSRDWWVHLSLHCKWTPPYTGTAALSLQCGFTLLFIRPIWIWCACLNWCAYLAFGARLFPQAFLGPSGLSVVQILTQQKMSTSLSSFVLKNWVHVSILVMVALRVARNEGYHFSKTIETTFWRSKMVKRKKRCCFLDP